MTDESKRDLTFKADVVVTIELHCETWIEMASTFEQAEGMSRAMVKAAAEAAKAEIDGTVKGVTVERIGPALVRRIVGTQVIAKPDDES